MIVKTDLVKLLSRLDDDDSIVVELHPGGIKVLAAADSTQESCNVGAKKDLLPWLATLDDNAIITAEFVEGGQQKLVSVGTTDDDDSGAVIEEWTAPKK